MKSDEIINNKKEELNCNNNKIKNEPENDE